MSPKLPEGIVYSTDVGRCCPRCQRQLSQCSCAAADAKKVRGNGAVRVQRESKGRGGKTVTVITGLAFNATQLDALASQLKRKCGCGGAVKDGAIEIQGDKVEMLLEELISRGIAAKRAGG